MRRNRLVTLLAGILSVALLTGAPTAALAADDPVLDATLRGTITQAGSTTALSNVTVVVEVPLEESAGFGSTPRTYSTSVFTDVDGDYEVAVPASVGQATIRLFPASTHFSKIVYATIPAGGTVERDVALALKPTGSASISGNVRIATGSFAGDVFVSVRRAGSTGGGSLAQTTLTAAGQTTVPYTIGSLPDGSYVVSASVDGQPYVDRKVVISGGAAATAQHLTITPYATGSGVITGRILDERTGAGIDGVTVTMSGSGSTSVRYAQYETDATGDFRFEGLPNGTYRVFAQIATATMPTGALGFVADDYTTLLADVTVAGGTAPAVSLSATSLVAGTSVLEGRVRDSTTYLPVPGAAVSLVRHNANLMIDTVETGSDGRFSIGGLSAGMYDVHVYLEGYASGFSTVSIAGPSNAVIVPLTPEGGTSPGTPGTGDLTVVLVDADDQPIETGTISLFVSSGGVPKQLLGHPDSTGTYVFEDLPLGFWSPSVSASADDGTDLQFAFQNVQLTSSTPNRTVEMVGGLPSRVVGTVSLNGFASTEVYPALYGPDGLARYSGSVADDGSFSVERVAPGTYYLQLAGGFGYTGDWIGAPPEILPSTVWWSSSVSAGVPDMSAATPIVIGSGEESAGHTFTAVAGASVRADILLDGPSGAAPLAPTRCGYLMPYRKVGSTWVEVQAETWACGSNPVIGKGLPTGTYKFKVGDFLSGNNAFQTTYVGGSSFETAREYALQAGRVLDLGSITVETPPPSAGTLDAIDLAFLLENGVDISAYEDLITTDDDLGSGEDASVDVGQDFAGQYVNVSLNSTPQVVGNTWHQVAGDGTVTVTLPSGTTGSHSLVVADTAGQLIGWTAVEIAQGTPTGGSGGTGGAVGGNAGGGNHGSPSQSVTPTPTATPTPTSTPTSSTRPEQPEEVPDEPETVAASGGDTSWVVWVVLGGLVVLVGGIATAIFVRRRAV